MKIERLDLRRFGAVSDRSLDLSAGAYGLHVLLGDNEAGKSTTLRAVMALLFGVPERTKDAFLHDGKDLRIGALLRDADGEAFEVIRRKGRKNTLLEADNKTVQDEARLAALLAGVGPELYGDAFGLSHETLREGGEALLAGRGDLAQMLFGAGVGAARLRGLQDGLRDELESLYKKQGSKPRLNELLRQHRELQKAQRDAVGAESAWRKADDAHTRAARELTETDAALQQLDERRNRLRRLAQAAPLVAERARCCEALAAFEDLPDVREDLAVERERLDAAISHLQQQLTRKAAAREEKVLALAEAELTEQERDLLESRSLLDDLRGRREAVREASVGGASVDEGGEEAASGDAAGTHDVGLDPQAVAAAMETLRGLQQQRLLLDRQLAEERDARELRAVELVEARAALERHGDPGSPELLDDLLASHAGLGAGVATLTGRRAELAERTERLAVEVAGLAGWESDAAALSAAQLPSLQAVKAARRRAEQLEAAVQERAEERRRIGERVADAEHELDVLRRGAGVPSVAELRGARDTRDLLWARVRRRWLGEDLSVDDDPTTSDAQLGDFHQDAAVTADRLADGLRLAAEQVARRAQIEAGLARDRRRLTELDEEERAGVAEQAAAGVAWQDLWAALSLASVGTPEEMEDWLGEAMRLRAAAVEVEGARAALAEVERQAAEAEDQLRAALADFDELPLAEDADLVALLDRCKRVAARLRSRQDERRMAEERLQVAEREDRTAAERQVKVEARVVENEAAWRGVVGHEVLAPLGLAALDRLEEVLAELAAVEARLRRAADRRLVRSFDQDVARLVVRVAPELHGRPALDAVDELQVRFGPLEQRRGRAASLQEDLERLGSELADDAASLQELRAERERLLRPLAGLASDDAGLDRLFARLTGRSRARAALADIEGRLGAVAEGLTIEQLAAEVAGQDPDRIAAERERAEVERSRLQAVRDELNEARVLARRELDAFDGSARAAELQAEVEELRAALVEEAGRYRVLATARELLAREIEAYRRAHQGPVVERASTLFCRLTLGEYQELEIDHGADDRSILLAVRGAPEHIARPELGGRRVEVEGLSHGTRDQLFLALKVATIETLIDGGRAPRLPVVLDDVLVHFDDRRTRAALEVLAELAAHTQVLLFTHHARVAELARAVATELDPAAGIVEHDLAGRDA